jgi:hypothetical protein
MARWTDPYASTSARTYTLWNRPDAKKVRAILNRRFIE